MTEVKLPEFLAFLRGLSASDFKGDAVDRYLQSCRIGEDEFTPFIFFREETYGRNLIFKNECFELLLLTWLPGQRTPIHNHSGQRCWVSVEAGTLTFKNFDPLQPGTSTLPKSRPAKTISQGDGVYIDDGIGLHSIVNADRKPAVSAHLYAGPVPYCHVYNEKLETFEVKELEYFTKADRGWDISAQLAQ